MVISRTNGEIDAMVDSLRPLLERKGIVGMVAARNTRVLAETIQEYTKVKEDLIREHGTEVDGGMAITPDSDAFGKFLDELEPYAMVRHDVDVMRIEIEKVMGDLTGTEMLALDWMLVMGE